MEMGRRRLIFCYLCGPAPACNLLLVYRIAAVILLKLLLRVAREEFGIIVFFCWRVDRGGYVSNMGMGPSLAS